jgi:hypothetical protein
MIKADGKVAHELYKAHARKEIILPANDLELLKRVHGSPKQTIPKTKTKTDKRDAVLDKIEPITYSEALEFILKRYKNTSMHDASCNPEIIRSLDNLEAMPDSFWANVDRFNNSGVWIPHPDVHGWKDLDLDALERFEKKNKAFMSKYKQFIIDAHFFMYLLKPDSLVMMIYGVAKEKYYDMYFKGNGRFEKKISVDELYKMLKSLPFTFLVVSPHNLRLHQYPRAIRKRVSPKLECNVLIERGF